MTCPSEIANLFAHQSCSLLDASSAARYLVHPEAQEFQIFLASRDSPGEVKTRHSGREIRIVPDGVQKEIRDQLTSWWVVYPMKFTRFLSNMTSQVPVWDF